MPALATDPDELRGQVRRWRRDGERVALVPTMGDLHAGHLALIEHAAARAGRVVVSIFVNPLQFGPAEDYTEYPRVLEQDRERLARLGVDRVFAPTVETLYPRGMDQAVRIGVPGLEDILCGADRPGHFAGVVTVVAKLFNIAEPDIAVFGEKDYQQLLIVRRLAADLAYAVDVQGVPTVRESDGLALSSRNGYLEPAERRVAARLHATLVEVARAVAAGDDDSDRLCTEAAARLGAAGFAPDYVTIRRSTDLAPPEPGDPPGSLRVLAAARLGRARLIDNVPVASSEP